MLTLANINATQAKSYYKQENYYSTEEAQVNSEWCGQGATQNNLQGPISNLEAYENIVDGLSPDGKAHLRQKHQFQQQQDGRQRKERVAVDLTFSAPKSVSIACLVGEQAQLEEAHRRAIRKVIDWIEVNQTETRVNGQRVKTGNLIVAMWHHDTSRELDPHLHTHCLLMNATMGPDGKWRSLSNEELYRNKILLGRLYRQELALECLKLGYQIEKHPKKLFEIKGYTREQIEAFSKRHEQILEKLVEVGESPTTENKLWAWRKTRARKNHEIGRNEKLTYWQQEADLYSAVHPIPTQEPQLPTPEAVQAEASEAVRVGIEHCCERQVAFKKEEIAKFVTAELRPFSVEALEAAIEQHPQLIKTFDERYTTQQALDRELVTLQLMQQGKGHVEAIATPEKVDEVLIAKLERLAQENKRLTQGQQEAVRLATTTQDQFVAWCGVAGSGKTYSLQLLKTIAEAQGYTVKGYAPSGAATKVLGQELEMEANTVTSLLLSKQPEQPQPKQLWIIDEAGLLNAKDGYKLLKRAREEGARIALVGDYRQNSAVEAGSPFRSLLSAGISTAFMDESLRQKNPELKQAADLAAAGQHLEALQHLEMVGRIQPIKDRGERTNTIAQAYLNLTPQERAETLILAGTHKEKGQIMHCIRQGLKAEGVLGEGIEATRLRQKQEFTDVQTR